MTICPKCYKTSRRDYPYTCKRKAEVIPVHKELMGVVIKLLERGIKVVLAKCESYPMDDSLPIKSTMITIEMGDLYPEAMFEGLPEGWVQYEYRRVIDDTIDEYRFTGLSCSERHYIGDNDAESVAFAKMLMISNLECWLNDRDVNSYYAVWRLAGVL